MTRILGVLVGLVLAAGAAGCGDRGVEKPSETDRTRPSLAPGDGQSTTTGGEATTGATTGTTGTPPVKPVKPVKPLAGKVVVLDPGHQLGNRKHGSEINDLVDGGGFEKPCNTTGTATNSGFPEATFVWRVAVKVRRQLRALGAQVVMTRDENSDEAWGPCVDERGSLGNPGQPGLTADVRISIHADGVTSSDAQGFHVIRPGDLDGWTDDIRRPSRRLALAFRDALVGDGFVPATYTGENGIDERSDLGTLNHSDVPTVMLELGNMRNADEADLMETDAGQRRYALAIVAGLRTYLG